MFSLVGVVRVLLKTGVPSTTRQTHMDVFRLVG